MKITSAFLDLVGIRDLARETPLTYYESLESFHRILRDKAHSLKGKSSAIYVFSDSVFIQADTFADLALFMQELRSSLLVEGLYFKASIRPGSLDAEEASFEDQNKRRILFGHSFGENAAALYGVQERLKGIGIIVDPSLRGEDKRNTLVDSCFLPQMNLRRSESYLDLRLAETDLNDGVLNRVLRNFLQAKSRSKKYGRFYISLLVLWVQSLDASTLGDKTKDGGFVALLLGGRFEAMFSDVLGIENVYLAFLDRLYRDRQSIPAALFHSALRFMLTRKRLTGALENTPPEILSDSSRRRFLNDLSADLLKEPLEEEELRQLTRQLIEAGTSNANIAREFNQLRIPGPHGRRWTRELVKDFLADKGGPDAFLGKVV